MIYSFLVNSETTLSIVTFVTETILIDFPILLLAHLLVRLFSNFSNNRVSKRFTLSNTVIKLLENIPAASARHFERIFAVINTSDRNCICF